MFFGEEERLIVLTDHKLFPDASAGVAEDFEVLGYFCKVVRYTHSIESGPHCRAASGEYPRTGMLLCEGIDRLGNGGQHFQTITVVGHGKVIDAY